MRERENERNCVSLGVVVSAMQKLNGRNVEREALEGVIFNRAVRASFRR